jgi:hypothetical protein
MNYAGCKRKFDVDAYVRKVAKFMSEPTVRTLNQRVKSFPDMTLTPH